MTNTPRPLKKLDSNPPPLDLGEAGAPPVEEHLMSPVPAASPAPIGPSEAGAASGSKRNVSFRNHQRDPGSTSPVQASPELRSSEDGQQTDSSSKPLYNEAGPSRPRSNTRTTLSPKFPFSPRFDTGQGKSPRAGSTRGGPRSLSTVSRSCTSLTQAD